MLASQDAVVLLYGVVACSSSPLPSKHLVVGELAAGDGEVQRARGLLGRRAVYLRLPGPVVKFVHIDALAVRLRPRSSFEAADFGVRICQSAAPSVYPCYAVAVVPAIGLALASVQIATWLPSVILWCAKPWLDRTILFVLSRAAFGQVTTPLDVWKAQRHVWWSQFAFTWTVRRFTPWRALTQPVYQLEGLSAWHARSRVRQIRRRNVSAALMVMSAFSLCEWGLTASLLSLLFWFAPTGQAPDVFGLLTDDGARRLSLQLAMTYAAIVCFIEPFYVASGFGMYLNRRADLEAWDIEQEFRRAFAS